MVVHVGEMRQILADSPELGAMTIAELFGKSAKTKLATPTGKPAKAQQPAIADVNVRTAEGRQAFDALVLKTLKATNKGQNVAAAELQVGGTDEQRRCSLNRLIEAGEVTFTGRARSTRYSVA